MFAYCLNNPISLSDTSGTIPFNEDPLQKAIEDFLRWYEETDENETDEEGELLLSAKAKKTVNSFVRNLEVEAGLGVGIGKIQEVLDHGVAYTCFYDIVSVQVSESGCDIGQRLVMSVYAAAVPYVEVGAGMDGFVKNGKVLNSPLWFPVNTSNKSITLFSFADYSYFIGGNITIKFDAVGFYQECKSIWR